MCIRLIPLLIVLSVICATGCGKAVPSVAPAGGKVTIDGKPMSSGYVLFAPLAVDEQGQAGKSAYGELQPDGSFVLGTFEKADGAVLGEHRVVIYNEGDSEKEDKAGKPSNVAKVDFTLLRISDRTFNVVADQQNNYAIELTDDYVRQFAEYGN